MPRILVDLLFFTGRKGGMETYTRELYTELASLETGWEFVGLASSEFLRLDHSWFPGNLIDSGISGESRVAWARGEISAVSRAARENRVDLIHSPANFGPWRSRVPVVLTIHDLLSFRDPSLSGRLNSMIVRLLVSRAAAAARRIITDSAASADDIRDYLGVDPARLDVVPLASRAPAPGLAAPPPPLDRPLLLSTGNRLPHKNFETLLRALALMPAARRPRLAITGSHGDDPLRPLVEELGLGDDVDLLSWISSEELETMYAQAAVYVIPSRFEGFGLPVLDAMNRGCAVIASDIPVLREVGGDAALYVDTTDAEALAGVILDVIGDDGIVADFRTAGEARAREFSWNRTATATLDSFRLALGLSPAD